MTVTPSLRRDTPDVEPLKRGRDERYVLLDLTQAKDGQLPAMMEDRDEWPKASEWIGGVTHRVPIAIGGHRTDLLLSTNNMGLPGSVGFIRGERFCVLAQGRFGLTVTALDTESDQDTINRAMGVVVENLGEVNDRLVLLVDDTGFPLPDERRD